MGLGLCCKPEDGRGADYYDFDRLSDEIHEGNATVEIALRSYLKAHTLKQFLLLTEVRASIRRVIACLISLGRGLSTLA
jgi:hypothetical protein